MKEDHDNVITINYQITYHRESQARANSSRDYQSTLLNSGFFSKKKPTTTKKGEDEQEIHNQSDQNQQDKGQPYYQGDCASNDEVNSELRKRRYNDKYYEK